MRIKDAMLSADEIRVLDLLPSNGADDDTSPICIETRVISIAGDLDFEALSYVWGQSHDFATITVDSNNVKITQNLERALRRIRLSGTKRTLWIDQLSIDQSNNQEKVHQIPLMNQIYSKTSRCLIWLGEVRVDIALSAAASAFEVIRFMSTYKQDETDLHAIPACLTSEETIYDPMLALGSICVNENPWWHRTWTLQEAILPSKAEVLWGPLSISWDTIVRAGRNKPVPPLDNVVKAHVDVVNRLVSQMNGIEYAREKSERPLKTAFRWHHRQATKIHDKVYGLLGLYPRGTFKRAECCDYELSLASLCAFFTVDMIEHQQNLHPIALWSRCDIQGGTPDIPGWAYDIAVTGRQHSILVRDVDVDWYLINQYEWYSAAGESKIDWSKFHFDAQSNSLSMTGFKVDEILLVAPGLERESPGSFYVSDSSLCSRIRRWYDAVESFYQGVDTSHTPYDWQDSFWRGLMGNAKVNRDFVPQRTMTWSDLQLLKQYVFTGSRTESSPDVIATVCHRTMFITSRGMLGFGPRHMSAGDQVWILHGGNVPFVLRPVDEDGCRFRFIGASYVHGIMHGEAVGTSESHTVTLL